MLRTPCWGVFVGSRFVTNAIPESGVVQDWSLWFPPLVPFAHTMICAPFDTWHGLVFGLQPPDTPMKKGPRFCGSLFLLTKFTQRPNRALAGRAMPRLTAMMDS